MGLFAIRCGYEGRFVAASVHFLPAARGGMVVRRNVKVDLYINAHMSRFQNDDHIILTDSIL